MRLDTDWTPAPARISIPAPGEVHVWRLDLAKESDRPWRGILAPGELARADRFHFERDRRTFAATRGVLRTLLGGYFNLPPESLDFKANPFGKPALKPSVNLPEILFNVTHSGDYALLAFTNAMEVGIDIERLATERDIEGLADFVFSQAEHARFRSLPDSKRESVFFQTWTAKEAIVKGLGGGLSIPVDRIEILFRTESPGEVSFHAPGIADASEWSVHGLSVHPGYASTLAAHARNVQMRLWNWAGGAG